MARKRKRNPLADNIGSVSHATMRPEDLIPAFIEQFDRQSPRSKSDRHLVAQIKRAARSKRYFDGENVAEDVYELFNVLNNYCLPYFYFGAHPGDGSDYGYWVSESITDDFVRVSDMADGDTSIMVEDTSEVPAKFSGEVLHTNDHGNMTLYSARKGKLTEVWSIV